MTLDPKIEYLLSLKVVRERAHIVYKLAEQGKLHHFDYHADRLDETAKYVMDIIEVSTSRLHLYIFKPYH